LYSNKNSKRKTTTPYMGISRLSLVVATLLVVVIGIASAQTVDGVPPQPIDPVTSKCLDCEIKCEDPKAVCDISRAYKCCDRFCVDSWAHRVCIIDTCAINVCIPPERQTCLPVLALEGILAQPGVCVVDTVKQCSSTGDPHIHLFPGYGGVVHNHDDGRHVLFSAEDAKRIYRVTAEHYNCRPPTTIKCNRYVTVEVIDRFSGAEIVRVTFASDIPSDVVRIEDLLNNAPDNKNCFAVTSLLAADQNVVDLLSHVGLVTGLAVGVGSIRIAPLNVLVSATSVVSYGCHGYLNVHITAPSSVADASTGLCVGHTYSVEKPLECPVCEIAQTKIGTATLMPCYERCAGVDLITCIALGCTNWAYRHCDPICPGERD
jgi:hypothetical protein